MGKWRQIIIYFGSIFILFCFGVFLAQFVVDFHFLFQCLSTPWSTYPTYLLIDTKLSWPAKISSLFHNTFDAHSKTYWQNSIQSTFPPPTVSVKSIVSWAPSLNFNISFERFEAYWILPAEWFGESKQCRERPVPVCHCRHPVHPSLTPFWVA